MIQTLSINPILKAAHYQYHFNMSRRTAFRAYNLDKAVLGKTRLTFLDFYTLYNAFPAPNFTPRWVSIPYVQKVPKVPNSAKSAMHSMC